MFDEAQVSVSAGTLYCSGISQRAGLQLKNSTTVIIGGNGAVAGGQGLPPEKALPPHQTWFTLEDLQTVTGHGGQSICTQAQMAMAQSILTQPSLR